MLSAPMQPRSPEGVVGRLAPTPSGHLHLGNALAFGAAWLAARSAGGRLLLRIEDLDRGRARPEIADSQRADLRWLGIDWDEEVAPQSTRHYPLDGLPLYRCTCPRQHRDRCRCRTEQAITTAASSHPSAGAGGVWRLACPPGAVAFVDAARGPLLLPCGPDPIVQRRDGEAAYPLAVVLDDHRDGVTQVVRGADLIAATPAQRVIAQALGLPPPATYLHVPLLLGADGRKLSKSHHSTELRALRSAGWAPARIWQALLPCLGLPPGHLHEALPLWSPSQIPQGPFVFGADGLRREG